MGTLIELLKAAHDADVQQATQQQLTTLYQIAQAQQDRIEAIQARQTTDWNATITLINTHAVMFGVLAVAMAMAFGALCWYMVRTDRRLKRIEQRLQP